MHLENTANQALEPFEKAISKENWQQQHRFIQQRLANARGTLAHYEAFLQALKQQNMSADDIRLFLEKSRLTDVQRMMSTGHYTEAQRLVGNPDTFRALTKQISRRQFETASAYMGASIEQHLTTALREASLRKLWLKRIPLGLGGSLLAATVLYTSLVVGRDFKSQSSGSALK